MRQTKRKQNEIVGRFFIYKAKGPNAQGKYHVKLRYTINRVEAIQGTGVWVLGKDWDDMGLLAYYSIYWAKSDKNNDI